MKNKEVLAKMLKTPEFARIHSHISADGYLAKSKQRRTIKELEKHPRKNKFRNKYHVRYVNMETVLVNQFIEDVKKLFFRKVVKLRRHEYELSAKWTYDLLYNHGARKSKEWFIPKVILNGNQNIKREWLKAFYDDESHVSKPGKRIVLNVVNYEGLKQVQILLKVFGIESTLNGPYKCREFFSYHLCIYRKSIKKYADKIGFNHPKKKKHLKEIIKEMKSGDTGTFVSKRNIRISEQ